MWMPENDAVGTGEQHLSRGSDDLCPFPLLSLFPAYHSGHMNLLLASGSSSLALMVP